jgi:protein-S-isoprenylcysteine O-methyltransferase Ste14
MRKGYKKQSHEHRIDLAGEYRWGDIGQIIFAILFIIGVNSDIFIFKISASWQEIIPWYLRIIMFIPFLYFAGYFAHRAHKKIFGERRKKLIVINTDVFSRLRHPMYFGTLLTYLGILILSISLVGLMIFIVIFIFYYYLCYYEEQVLIENLGDEYRKYMKEVPMLIPRLKK